MSSSFRPVIAPLQCVDAAEEQAWNELQFATPLRAAAARLWCYPQGAVVLGRSQRALLAALEAHGGGGYRVIGRAAGGGAVLVGPWMLGVSVVLPLAHPLLATASIADSYRWFGEAMVAALADCGVTAQSVPRAQSWRAPAHLAWACYAGMSPWEVAVGGRKLAGFAQRRGRHGVLLVAGVLLARVPWEDLCQAMGKPAAQARELANATISTEAVIGRPLPAKDLAAAVVPCLALALADAVLAAS